jgi:hypothetical protein
MSRSHSKLTVITVGGTDISEFCNTSEFNPTTDSHDVTTYGNDGHIYDGGLTDGTFTCGGFYDTSTSSGPRTVLMALKGSNATTTVVRQVEGSGAGKPQDSFTGLLTSYTESSPVNDFVQWSAEFQISGDVTSSTQTSG